MNSTRPRLGYIVLRCGDLGLSRAFYQALGLELVPEQHGRGARHYSCSLGDLVLELYAATEANTSGLRLGFRVENVSAAVEAARHAGGAIVRVDSGPSPTSAVLRDPDGHEVALEVDTGRTDS